MSADILLFFYQLLSADGGANKHALTAYQIRTWSPDGGTSSLCLIGEERLTLESTLVTERETRPVSDHFRTLIFIAALLLFSDTKQAGDSTSELLLQYQVITARLRRPEEFTVKILS